MRPLLRLTPTLRILLLVIVEEKTMLNARFFGFSALVLASFCLFASPALAQDDPLEAESALLEGAELEEREKAPEIEEVDPDDKAAKAIKDAEARIEKRINELQPNASKLVDVEEALGRISNKLGTAQYKYLETVNPLLDSYRAANANRDKKKMKKAGRNIAKARKKYSKVLKSIEKKDFPKLEKLEKKLQKLVAEEDAEKAKAEAEAEAEEE